MFRGKKDRAEARDVKTIALSDCQTTLTGT